MEKGDEAVIEKMEESSQADISLKNWEFLNGVQPVEKIYEYNAAEQNAILSVKPWEKDYNYFKEVKISALALLKMVMHARSGGNLEIMGVVQGKIDANALIVMDSFALPVEGTETRVNAQSQAYEYMITYINHCEEVGRLDKIIGWYHSHPGYGCWLSGIDVATQLLHQTYQEPFVAIVVDPIRTMSSGKVDLGAFRTYPKGYKAPDDLPSDFQSIPSDKIEDFGVHCKQYYSLDVSYFKSALDARLLSSLWNTYWVNTSSRAPPLINDSHYITSQLKDLYEKLHYMSTKGFLHSVSEKERRCRKSVVDGKKISSGILHGLLVQQFKSALFRRTL